MFSYCISQYLIVFCAYHSTHVVGIEFVIARGVGQIHTATQVNHDDHTLYRHLLKFSLSTDSPVLDSGFPYSIFVRFCTEQASLTSEVDSTILTIDHLCISVYPMSIFFVEILNRIPKSGGYVPLGLVEEVFPVFLEELHALNIIMIVRIVEQIVLLVVIAINHENTCLQFQQSPQAINDSYYRKFLYFNMDSFIFFII